ncbi:hypothetical protein T265_06961 [Opisthorchis viverrini]|uniref:Uncharacterized protein n=1 Tax=Opisthorchis viverrini TaxID=6198 RepID=A0A074ZII7_OPIVI|nr:hypothetical protein T265_06961 [Opisthorchis viverrini]KER25607.1 hypothetical protein T265_06961 [Opisthorchis viverrini]
MSLCLMLQTITPRLPYQNLKTPNSLFLLNLIESKQSKKSSSLIAISQLQVSESGSANNWLIVTTQATYRNVEAIACRQQIMAADGCWMPDGATVPEFPVKPGGVSDGSNTLKADQDQMLSMVNESLSGE